MKINIAVDIVPDPTIDTAALSPVISYVVTTSLHNIPGVTAVTVAEVSTEAPE